MKIAAYCRVSTDKEDQLNSLEAQKKFFAEYTQRAGDTLVRLYADEGISGTKIKNRKEFLRMMDDARRGVFELVVVKDISRFARNTVDLLQNIRTLKALGIETQFLTANMTSMGNSEFVLTIFGALAQEESANTSKRIKFGKKINAERGKVPNFVYGYNKTVGDIFNLTVNDREADVVRKIFSWYLNEGCGAAKIANRLNAQGIRTKRGCKWIANTVVRILTNEIYTGKIINGKVEITDFLTGQRKKKDRSEWFVTERSDLQIIDRETFEEAQVVLRGRGQAFKLDRERHSNKYLFSTLIKCKECGWSFRRVERTYRNTYITWVCSGRNGKGAGSCPNQTIIDEKELMQALTEYFARILANRNEVVKYFVAAFEKAYRAKNENVAYEKDLNAELAKLTKSRQKFMDMYSDDLISREELNERLSGMRERIEYLEKELKTVTGRLSVQGRLESILNQTFRSIEDIADVSQMTNAKLRKIIRRIEVDRFGNVDIFLHLLQDLDLGDSLAVEDDRTGEQSGERFLWEIK